MRRIERERDEVFALDVADKCMYATLSMVDENGEAYAVPVTIARAGKEIYFHCAQAGKKIDCLRKNPRVCVTCVGDVRVVEEKFTVAYESAMFFGQASELTDAAEKTRAMRLICQRHTPSNMAAFDETMQRAVMHTAVWRVVADTITGKCNPLN